MNMRLALNAAGVDDTAELTGSRRMRLGHQPKGFGSQMGDNPCCNYAIDRGRLQSAGSAAFMYQTSASQYGAGVAPPASGHARAMRARVRASSRQRHVDEIKQERCRRPQSASAASGGLHWRNEREMHRYANEVSANPGTVELNKSVNAGARHEFVPQKQHFAYETAANAWGKQTPMWTGRIPRKDRFAATANGFLPHGNDMQLTVTRDATHEPLQLERSGGRGTWRGGEKTFMGVQTR